MPRGHRIPGAWLTAINKHPSAALTRGNVPGRAGAGDFPACPTPAAPTPCPARDSLFGVIPLQPPSAVRLAVENGTG
jgi:hypothetical protein